jgi:DnaJ-class molecular chaperone
MSDLEKNYYEILDVSRNASQYEIKKKYSILALKYHPDRNRHLKAEEYIENEEKFKELTIAFKTLYDPTERNKYDQILDSKTTSRKHVFYSFYSTKNSKLHFTISSFLIGMLNKLFTDEQIQTGKDFFNILKNFIHFSHNEQYNQNITELAKNFKVFYQQKNNKRETTNIPKNIPTNKTTKVNIYLTNDNIEDSSNNNKNDLLNINAIQSTNNEIANSSDSKDVNDSNKTNKFINKKIIKTPLIYNVSVSLADIYNEIPKELTIARLRKCHLCLGHGYLGYGIHMSLCHICKGLMKIVENIIFPIDIKEKTIVFKEEGSEDSNGEINDLIVNIHPKPNNDFQISNDYDLIYHHKVNLIELYSEINIRFTHLDSKDYLIKYSEKTNDNYDNDKIFNKMEIIVPNLGLSKGTMGLKDERGNLIIKLSVMLPALSPSEINKLIEMNVFDKIKNRKTNHNLEHDNLQILEIKI